MYSSLRILLPPNARPLLTSSRLAQTWAPPRCVAEPAQVLQRARPEGERVARDLVETHAAGSTTDNPGAVGGVRGPVLVSRDDRPAPRPDRPPAHARRPRRGVRRVLRCRGRGLRAPRARARGHRRRLGAAELRPRDRQHRGVRRRPAGRRRRGDHGWAARRGRRAAGRARARHRVVARGVDRAAGDLARIVAGRPGGTGRVAPPAPAARVAATRWATPRGCSSCPRVARSPQRSLPRGYALATGDTAERERAAYVVIQDAFDEWEGRVRDVLRGLGGDHRAPPRGAAVAAAGRRARRGGRGGIVHDPRQPGGRVRGPARRRAVAPWEGAGPGAARRCVRRAHASAARRAASCRPTRAPGRSTSTSRSGWRSPRSGRTW